MYQLHETNETISEAKTPKKKESVETEVDGELSLVSSESLQTEQQDGRYVNINQFEHENKRFSSDMPRYLINEDFCERYEDRYSELGDHHHRLTLHSVKPRGHF